MKIELSKEEMGNVYIALVTLAKSNQVDAQGMEILLVLARKFAPAEKPEEKGKEKSK